MDRKYCVYIPGNERPTLYIGITNDLLRRAYQHKQGLATGFTKKYNLKKLLYFEEHTSPTDAIEKGETPQALESFLEN